MNNKYESNLIHFPKSFDQRIDEAMNLYYEGDGQGAESTLKKLIDEGCTEANTYLALLYECGGNGVIENIDNSIFYYERSIEELGAVEGYLGLARIYYYGLGGSIDYCKALEYYKKVASEANNGFAYFMMGNMYLDGLCVNQDITIAKDLYRKSWDLGYVYALTKLGLLAQKHGSFFKGWKMRIKAGYHGLKLANEDEYHPNLREY